MNAIARRTRQARWSSCQALTIAPHGPPISPPTALLHLPCVQRVLPTKVIRNWHRFPRNISEPLKALPQKRQKRHSQKRQIGRSRRGAGKDRDDVPLDSAGTREHRGAECERGHQRRQHGSRGSRGVAPHRASRISQDRVRLHRYGHAHPQPVLRADRDRLVRPYRPGGSGGLDPVHRVRAGTTSAVAIAAIPSPRPVRPRPSVVVAERLTGAPDNASASTAAASSRRGPSLGRLPITHTDTLPIVYPAAATRRAVSRSSATPEAPAHSGRDVPKFTPRSPSPAADKSASHAACAATSPSECPARPVSPGHSSPARCKGRPASNGWTSTPTPTRGTIPRASGSSPPGECTVTGAGYRERLGPSTRAAPARTRRDAARTRRDGRWCYSAREDPIGRAKLHHRRDGRWCYSAR